MAGKVSITARVAYGTRARLADRLAEERARKKAIMTERRWRVPPEAPAAERARLRAALRAHLRRLRERGELCDTVDGLIEHAVRAELVAREWDHRWPPVPAYAPKAGRWPGSREAGWSEQIPARIPVQLAERVHAACWHTSAEAIEALWRWRDRNPGVITPRDDPTTYAEYDDLARQVTTPGMVWRAAVTRMLG